MIECKNFSALNQVNNETNNIDSIREIKMALSSK